MVPPKSDYSSMVSNLDEAGFVLPRTQLYLVWNLFCCVNEPSHRIEVFQQKLSSSQNTVQNKCTYMAS